VGRSAAHHESEFPQNLKGVIAFASTLGCSCERCCAWVSIRCASLPCSLCNWESGKEVAELSMELFLGLLRAASEMAGEAGLNPGLVIGTTIQLVRAVDERTDSILHRGHGPGKI
jgi:hypothetical protein